MARPQVRENKRSFADLDGWAEEDHGSALAAFAALAQSKKSIPSSRALGIDGGTLAELARQAASLDLNDGSVARAFFETRFEPVEYTADDAEHVPFAGLLTGYFEPEVKASRTKTADFPVPIYRRPDDLIDLDDNNRPQTLPKDYRFGRLLDGEIVPYFDRRQINDGALDHLDLELAYVSDLTTAFFVHVQGAGRLIFDDGTTQRITFAAKAGHPYTSLGAVLCDMLEMSREDMTADCLADWMRSNPDRLKEFLAHNRSYIFFEEENQSRADQGPVAAAKLPLIAGRSMAVDRTLHTFGTPIWVATQQPLPDESTPLRRLMMAHDTGSIIQGVQRGDYFAGSGAGAGSVAGRMIHACSMVVLKPRLCGG
ncbi:MAG: MltA domain-containing protein [Pseudomonadota bacterium]